VLVSGRAGNSLFIFSLGRLNPPPRQTIVVHTRVVIRSRLPHHQRSRWADTFGRQHPGGIEQRRRRAGGERPYSDIKQLSAITAARLPAVIG
jgi:hypothetical protein